MVIYECDMCGQQFPHESYVHDVIAHEKASEEPLGDGTVKFNVCHDCSRLIGEFIRGHQSRIKGLRRSDEYLQAICKKNRELNVGVDTTF